MTSCDYLWLGDITTLSDNLAGSKFCVNIFKSLLSTCPYWFSIYSDQEWDNLSNPLLDELYSIWQVNFS